MRDAGTGRGVGADAATSPMDAMATDVWSSGDIGPARDAGFGLDTSASDSGAPACYHDRFDPCDDPYETTPAERNDEWSAATYFNDNSSIGCRVGDNLITLDRTRQGVICPNEAGDHYQVTFVHCDTLTMNLELRLHPTTMCPADSVELEFRGHPCDNTDPRLRCTTDGLDKVIQLWVPPGRTVGGWSFEVRSPQDDVRFEYELTLRLN